MKPRTAVTVCCLMALLAVAAPAQHRRGHDPLTYAEADELREVAQDPPRRLKLFIKYASARLQSIEQLRGDPKTAEGRGRRIHDLLQDFTTLVDELDDNVNMYANRKEDISKPLGEVITADTEWKLKLRTLKEAADATSIAEARDYSFVLETATDAVNASISNARDVQDEIAKRKQEEKEEQKKKSKKK